MRKQPRATLASFSLFVMREDDERFKLKKGDVFVGAPYQYDPGKTSVAFRIRDGFDPGCNQYNNSIRPLTAEETERVMWGGKL